MGKPWMAAFRLKMQVATEKQEHQALMKWVSLNAEIRDFVIHIPNEYDGGIAGGFQRKLMGVKRGVSDLFLALPKKGRGGLWIELKRRVGGKVSVEQLDWVNKMNAVGYDAFVCYGWEDAVNKIKEYLS